MLVTAAIQSDFRAVGAPILFYTTLLLIYAFLLSFKIVLTDNKLSVRNLFVWHHIRLSDIERAYIQTSMKTRTGGQMMTFRIWIEPRKELGRKGFYIPLVNYKPEELQELYRVLGIRSKRTRMFSRAKAG